MHDAPMADSFLAEVTRNLAARIRPWRIVLFGSRARGDARPDSDYDLLVLLETDRSRRERAALVRHALGDVPPAVDVVVLTPAEFALQRDDVGTTAYHIHREGRVLYAAPDQRGASTSRPPRVRERRHPPESLRWWLARVENDLHAMEQLIAARSIIPDAVCFHAHQAVEKLLEAVLVSLHLAPPRTHRLDVLLARCPPEVRDDVVVRSRCLILQDIWPLSRYPDALDPAGSSGPSVEDAEAAAEAARAVCHRVLPRFGRPH